MYNLVVFSIFTHHHHLIPEYFGHPEKKSPTASPWQPLIHLHFLLLQVNSASSRGEAVAVSTAGLERVLFAKQIFSSCHHQ